MKNKIVFSKRKYFEKNMESKVVFQEFQMQLPKEVSDEIELFAKMDLEKARLAVALARFKYEEAEEALRKYREEEIK